jgi:hypothetical protein
VALRIASAFTIVLLAFGASAGSPELPGVSTGGAPASAADAASDPARSQRLDRVVIAPLNLSVRAPQELEGKEAPVWQELLRYFQERDRDVAVLNGISAERLWLQATADLDRSDGPAALREATARFARELAKHREYDLLVIPSLVLRPGTLNGWSASWDGVQREVPNAARLAHTDMTEVAGPGIQAGGLSGKVAAVSLHVSLLGADGGEVYQGLGGIDVLQEAHREGVWEGDLEFVTRSEPFSNGEAVRDGVERAFESPTLAAARQRW